MKMIVAAIALFASISAASAQQWPCGRTVLRDGYGNVVHVHDQYCGYGGINRSYGGGFAPQRRNPPGTYNAAPYNCLGISCTVEIGRGWR